VDDQAAVLEAHQAFYDAFESRDLDRMSDLWEHSDRVVCTHPGWTRLRGWAAVSASWFSLFSGSQRLQFILTNIEVDIVGDVALVSVDENLLSEQASGTVAALNVFVRAGGAEFGWRMLAHHGAPVATR